MNRTSLLVLSLALAAGGSVPANAAPNATALEAQYRQLCAPGGSLSAATCAAMAKDVAKAKEAAPTVASAEAAPAVDPAKLRANYDRLCGATPLASAETCARLVQDLAAFTPATEGDALARRQAAAEAFVRGFGAGTVSDRQLWSGQRAALRKAVSAYQSQVSTFGELKSLRWLRLEGGEDVYEGRHATGIVEWRFAMRPDGSASGVHFKDSRRLNANRNVVLTAGAKPVDRIVPGQTIQAMFESSDGAFENWPWRADCYLIVAPPGTMLKLSLNVQGIPVESRVNDSCDFTGQYNTNYGSDNAYGIYIRQGAQPLYVRVSGRAALGGAKPYSVFLETVTPQQYAEYQERQRRQRIADQQARQQRDADRDMMFGAMVRGTVAGLTNTSPPLMNPDGSAPNMLETLNAVNSELAQRNAEGQARLNATIAAAQTQGQTPMRSQPGGAPQQVAQAQPAPAQPPRPAAAPQRKAYRAYFVAGMDPTPSDTRNPMCYSNVFTITLEVEPNGWGMAGRAEAAMKPYESSFLAKCARLGRLSSGLATGNVEGITSGWPYSPHPTDRRVQIP